MMNRNHRLIGGSTAFVVTTAAGLPAEVVAASMIGAMVGSSFPDDVEKPLGLPHRRISHYPAAQIAFCLGIAALASTQWPSYAGLIWFSAVSVALGCVMHSVADAMTVKPDGIRLLWPLSQRGYHLLPWKLRVWTGSKSRSERVFVAIWVGFVLIYAYARFGSVISA